VQECWHKCPFHVSIPKYVRFSFFFPSPTCCYISLAYAVATNCSPYHTQWYTQSVGLLWTRDQPVSQYVSLTAHNIDQLELHVSLQLLFQKCGVPINISRVSAEMRSEMCVRHMKCPTLLSDFNKTWNEQTFFLQNSAIQNISSTLLQFIVPYFPCWTRQRILKSFIKRVTSQKIYESDRIL